MVDLGVSDFAIPPQRATGQANATSYCSSTPDGLLVSLPRPPPAGALIRTAQSWRLSRLSFVAQFAVSPDARGAADELVVFLSDDIVTYRGNEIGLIVDGSNGEIRVYSGGAGGKPPLRRLPLFTWNDTLPHRFDLWLTNNLGLVGPGVWVYQDYTPRGYLQAPKLKGVPVWINFQAGSSPGQTTGWDTFLRIRNVRVC